MARKKKKKASGEADGRKVVARNKRARHRFDIEEVMEAGIVLAGTEVKSLREGQAGLREAYADIKDGEVYLENCHIAPYSHATYANHDPYRPRKLLLHGQQIKRLIGKVAEKGYSLVPLEIYFSRGLAKVSLGLGKGKKVVDRREEIKRRDLDREMQREKSRYK